jgi:hypothetical protein
VRHSLTSGGAASSTQGEGQAHGQETDCGVEVLEEGPSLQQVYHSERGGDAGREHAFHLGEDMQRAGGEKNKVKKF